METTKTDTLYLDAHLAKFSYACVVTFTGLAFLFNQPVLVLIIVLFQALSALFPAAGPFRLIYRRIVLPLGLLKPRMVEDDPAPHRFAQGMGATFLLVSSLFLFLTTEQAVGWALDLMVFVLASINLVVGFCAGCFIYYHLGRWGVLPRVRYEGGFHWRGV